MWLRGHRLFVSVRVFLDRGLRGERINHSEGAAIHCSRVANGYPEVCLIPSLVDAATLVVENNSTVYVRKMAQSRLREAHLEEARP